MTIYISASLLEDFVSCNRKVYYRINKPEKSIQNRGMTIGEVVHKAIELHWNDELTANFYTEIELKSRLPDDKSALKHAQDCLQSYFHNFRQYLSEKDEVEIKFKLHWDKDVAIVGKIDRISDGKVFDWKTAKSPLSNISGNIQFILYNWAYKHMYNKLPSGVYYAALTNGSLVKYDNDPIASSVLFNEIIPDAIMAIRGRNYIRNGVFRKACYMCPYAKTCLEEVNDELARTTHIEK